MHPKTIITMKRVSFFLLLLGLLAFSGCKNENSEDRGEIRATGTVGPARIPPQNQMTNALMEGYWAFEHHVVPNDPEGTNFNKGRWYNFYPDGTYEGGHWQEQTDYGHWYYRVTPDQTFVLVDSEVNDLNDAEWEVQQSTRDYTAMSWVRTGNFGDQRKILGKIIKVLDPPTRESFAVE